MAAGTSPIFVATPQMWQVSSGVNANTALDGSGSVALLLTAGANGSKVETVTINPLGTNIATVMRFFVDITGAGTSYKLVHEETMAANTLSQVAASVPNIWRANLILPAGAKMAVTIGTAVASGFLISAQGGDW